MVAADASDASDASDALAVRDKVQKFLNAARTGNTEAFKNLAKQLDTGKGIEQTVADVKDANNRGALHFAAREGKTDICKYLVEELKLDVNTKDEDGETPLLRAARLGHTETAKYLLDCGADPAISSQLGATAVHHSAVIGDIEMMKFLISRGLDVNLRSGAGTPLIWAAGHGQQDAVRLLLEHHADPNIATEDDVTPLLSVVAAGSLPCLELLVQAGADVNVTAGGATPLHIAADNGSPEMIECLLKGGADPNAVDEERLKPIEVASAKGNRKAVEILFYVTSQIQSIPEWSVDGILKHVQSETVGKTQEESEATKQKNASIQKQPLPEVAPKAKKKAAEAKARGDYAFKRKDFPKTVGAYTQMSTSNTKKKLEGVVLQKAKWDSKTTEIFLEACLEQYQLNPHASRNKLRKGEWQNVLAKFNAMTGNDYDRTQLKNRWDNLRKKWQLWWNLKTKETGLRWDHFKQIPADVTPDWWIKKEAENRLYAKIKDGFTIGPMLTNLFLDVADTGQDAWVPTSGYVSQFEQEFDLQQDEANYNQHVDLEECARYRDNADAEPSVGVGMTSFNLNSSGTARSGEKRDRIGRRKKGSFKDNGPISIPTVIADLKEIPGIMDDMDFFTDCCMVLTRKVVREVYMEMDTNHAKMAWLQKAMLDYKARLSHGSGDI